MFKTLEYKKEKHLANFELVKVKLREVEEKDNLRNWQPPISGEDIMKIFDLKPSKEIGLIKNAIREAILEGNIGNNFEEAQSFMFSYAKGLGLEAAND